MEKQSKCNVALSPIGYWPYGVRPSWGRQSKRPVRPLKLLPLIFVLGFSLSSLAGCAPLTTGPFRFQQALKTTLNNLMQAGDLFLADEANHIGQYLAQNVRDWDRRA